jgi:hypothetical protein
MRAERELWEKFCQFVNYGYGERDDYMLWVSLDRFRQLPSQPPAPFSPGAPADSG